MTEQSSSNSTMGAISGTLQSMAAAPMVAHVAKINEHAATDFSGAVIALLTALPFGSAALIMLFMAKHSASTGEPTGHARLRFEHFYIEPAAQLPDPQRSLHKANSLQSAA